MQFRRIISQQPYCTYCGKLMDEWIVFCKNNEHPECTAERISNKLMERIREQFEKVKSEKP